MTSRILPASPPPASPPRILVVEDDADLAFGLRNNLEIDGYEVDVLGDGESAVTRAAAWRPALIILDLMLPGMDGLRVLRAIRARDADVRVLVLTARGDEADKVRGLKLGADDYVTKPFGLLELLARVESLLRRSGAGVRDHGGASSTSATDDSASDTASDDSGRSSRDTTTGGASGADDKRVLRIGAIEVHRASRQVFKSGALVPLRPKEFDLLVELLRHRGAVVSRVALMQAVWGYSSAVISRTIDTHIGELRRKLEADASRPRHIVTVRGVGYRLDD